MRDLLFTVRELILFVMKRIHLIETGVLVTALICGYRALDNMIHTVTNWLAGPSANNTLVLDAEKNTEDVHK